jgi:hypothetical protein
MSQRRVQAPYNHQKDSIAEYLCPADGYRGRLSKKGIQPKNHMKDNLKELRSAQDRMRMKREEDAVPQKPLYKLPQFQGVESRLYNVPMSGKENSYQRRGSFDDSADQGNSEKAFLTRGQSELRREEIMREKRAIRAEVDRQLEEERLLNEQLETRKAPAPKRNEVALLKPPSNADFITRNKLTAMTLEPQRKGSQDEIHRHEEFGRVPQYLEERKAQWQEEEEDRRRRLPDPDCPAGMMLMSEEERRGTLSVLEQSREEAMQQLRRLPFVIETPSMRKKQEMLENKLREIDRALGIFSKPKVYVALDR